MRFKVALATVFLLFAAFGCGAEETSISPLPSGAGSSDLGSGVRPLSFGPGYKGSPAWSSDGERIAFTVDGYVVDKSVRGGEPTRWTARDFGATEIEAHAGDSMLLLGSDGENAETGTLYESLESDSDSPEIAEISPDILAAERLGASDAVLAAIRENPDESVIRVAREDGVGRAFGEPVAGTVTGVSLSPNQRRAALAVAPPGEEAATELRVLDLASGSGAEASSLSDGRQIYGSPQWTQSGIYFVAGTKAGEGEGSSPYKLYRITDDSGEPEAAPGIGEEFTPASIKVSPDGTKLAIIGRLHANSPTNLHILDLREDAFTSVTSSEDVEIKNGSTDMAWSPDGESVAIVARGSFSNPAVRAAPADNLLEEFYNLYEVPVEVG